ncbi:MAG TPA: dihydrodipicolinate reductase C-terminal domain-containing protein [Candidatus Saccharimonadales bacterium]|nr:dihydrodipicolinate reductase C-terminal domain-containing protein [Candidatus Saccharimonadales bacterium]
MKVALLGTGRTGGRVIDILGEENVTGFNENNPPTLEKLRACDVAISFLPGPGLMEHLDMLIESKLPVATGSTGFVWPDNVDRRLKENGVAWVTASNFSLGMNLVYGMIKVLSKTPKLFDEYEFKLHEIHHIHKKDQPSGTALSWEKWLGRKVDITSERIGDNPGEHKLTLVTPYEDITLEHKSKDRRIFAQGAIWTARKLAAGGIEPGLHNLQDIMEKELGI